MKPTAKHQNRLLLGQPRILGLRALLLAAMLTVAGCGGGGGGGGTDGSDTGSVSTQVEPNVITEGGLAFVTVNFNQADFDDLDTQGVTIKLLIPSEFGFLTGSASLTTDRGAVPFEPLSIADAPRGDSNDLLSENDIKPQIGTQSQGAFSYYVFPIPADALKDEDRAELKMSFAVGSIPASAVIFTDLDRGAIVSFDPADADFDVENVTTFQVVKETDED